MPSRTRSSNRLRRSNSTPPQPTRGGPQQQVHQGTPPQGGPQQQVHQGTTPQGGPQQQVHQGIPPMAAAQIPGLPDALHPTPAQIKMKEDFNHICNVVLQQDDNSELKQALLRIGVNNMRQLLAMKEEVIEALVKADGTPFNPSDKNLIQLFQCYSTWRCDGNNRINGAWTDVTQEMFEDFCINDYLTIRGPASNYAQHVRTTKTAAVQFAGLSTPVEIFRKGIKRDPTLFPSLKDERFNDTWHRSFLAQARAQNVQNVLDHNYVPADPTEEELFNEQQRYVYAVFESKVLTDMGKKFVRDHEDDSDAQAVYRKLTLHHTKSTKASMDSANLLSYITSARLGSGEWKGSTAGFVIHWQDKVRIYEKQVPRSDHFSDGQKRTMLQNAVQLIKELRAVKNSADMERTKSGHELSYDEYTSLLLSVCTAYD